MRYHSYTTCTVHNAIVLWYSVWVWDYLFRIGVELSSYNLLCISSRNTAYFVCLLYHPKSWTSLVCVLCLHPLCWRMHYLMRPTSEDRILPPSSVLDWQCPIIICWGPLPTELLSHLSLSQMVPDSTFYYGKVTQVMSLCWGVQQGLLSKNHTHNLIIIIMSFIL